MDSHDAYQFTRRCRDGVPSDGTQVVKWKDSRPWSVQQAQRNIMLHNPICRHCGFRTYPAWGEHKCHKRGDPISDEDYAKVRHWAGMIASYLDFYRLPPNVQAEALILALAYILGRNTNGRRGANKFLASVPWIKRTILRQGGLDPRLIVRSLAMPKTRRMTARKTRKKVKS